MSNSAQTPLLTSGSNFYGPHWRGAQKLHMVLDGTGAVKKLAVKLRVVNFQDTDRFSQKD